MPQSLTITFQIVNLKWPVHTYQYHRRGGYVQMETLEQICVTMEPWAGLYQNADPWDEKVISKWEP